MFEILVTKKNKFENYELRRLMRELLEKKRSFSVKSCLFSIDDVKEYRYVTNSYIMIYTNMEYSENKSERYNGIALYLDNSGVGEYFSWGVRENHNGKLEIGILIKKEESELIFYFYIVEDDLPKVEVKDKTLF